jgi:hypothetical protein
MQRMIRSTLVVSAVVTVLVPLASGSTAHRSNALNSPGVCPVTLPNHVTPPGQGNSPYGYQHGGLWVELWPFGVTFVGVHDVAGDGSLAVKVPWYRFSSGKLRITATRLDAPAPKPKVRIPSGYGGRGFQSSAISFPAEGCWRVTATAGHTQLTYVTVVMKTLTVRQEVPRG